MSNKFFNFGFKLFGISPYITLFIFVSGDKIRVTIMILFFLASFIKFCISSEFWVEFPSDKIMILKFFKLYEI